MNDAVRLGAILAASFLAAIAVQRFRDRRAARHLRESAARLGLSGQPLPGPEEIRGALPFLGSLGDAEAVAIWSGTIRGSEAHLVALRATLRGPLGYTLLARRVAAWSARAVVRPVSVTAGPAPGGPDPRRITALERPELLAALARAGAWLHIEGPWRVLGTPVLASAAAAGRLAALSEEIETLVEEPSEFAGGLEWNV